MKLWSVMGMAALLTLAGGCGPSTPEECLNAAVERGANGDWKKALKLANRAVDRSPDNVAGMVLRAVAYERLKDRDRALDAALQAATRHPDSFLAQYTLGRMYAEDPARSTEALRALGRASELSGRKDRNTQILLANVSVAGRVPLARDYLDQLLAAAPEMQGSAAFQNLQGIYYIQNGQAANARAAFNNALNLERGNPVVTYNAGRLLDLYSSNAAGARRFYETFMQLTANKPEEYQQLREKVRDRLVYLDAAR